MNAKMAEFAKKMREGKAAKEQKIAELAEKVQNDQLTREQAAQELLEKMTELGMVQSLKYCQLHIDQAVDANFAGLKLGRHV